MTYRSKSPRRVVDEFSQLSQHYGLQKFQVVDNILDMKHIDTVLPIFAQLKEPYTIFYETKANLKYQQIKQLTEAGVRFIQPGIENMHDSALKLLKKGNTALMNVQLLKWAREFGLRVAWNFLVNMPGESDEWYVETAKWLPLIVHLHPPTNVCKLRYDRFSPYHEQSTAYGLNLLPSRAYSYVYPLSPEALVDFAYYFEDAKQLACETSEKPPPLYGGEKFEHPGHKVLDEWVNQWKELFWSERSPLLSMVEDGKQRLKIVDTRFCAVQSEQNLEGLAYWVYVSCDRALTAGELIAELHAKYGVDVCWDEIQSVVEELRDRKILLELNNRFLSLAVRSPFPALVKVSDAPAGHINLHRYQQFIRKQILESQGFIRI